MHKIHDQNLTTEDRAYYREEIQRIRSHRKDLRKDGYHAKRMCSLLLKAATIAKNWRSEDTSSVRSSVFGCMNMMTVPAGIKSQCWRAEEKMHAVLDGEQHFNPVIRNAIDVFQRYLRTRA
jgi:hypothetical protein